MKKPKPSEGKRTTAKRVADADKPFTLPTVPVKPETDEDAWGEDGMTVRQRLFVEALIGPAGGNASKAAELAGYAAENRESLKVTASRLLTYANVQRALSRKIAARFGSPEDVRNGIAEIANSNAADFLEPDDKGKLHLNLERMAAAGALGLIHRIEEDVIDVGNGTASVIKRKLRMYDRLKALELLGKLNGQFVEKRDITSGGKIVKVLSGVSMDEL